MDLKTRLSELKRKSSGLNPSAHAKLSCQLAKQLEKAGDYETAAEALSDYWPEPHQPPRLENLDQAAKAEVLLRVGALTGWLGSARQAEGSQEKGKDFITASLEIFEELRKQEKMAEALSDLAICYWREGAFDEARVSLENALPKIEKNDQLRAVILVRKGMVELASQRLIEALRIFSESRSIVENHGDDAIKGTFHNLFAVLFRRLATAENSEDYLDRALIEYAAASFHFEEAGNARFQGCVDINLGFLFGTLGKYSESHKYLDRAKSSFFAIGDEVHIAQVNDALARTLIAESKFDEADRLVRSAIKSLEKGDEMALLAEALTTYGVVLARMGKQPSARAQIERAVEVAETAGDIEGAGRARLTLIEELSNQSPMKDMVRIYQSAIDSLKNSQDASNLKRLISCADILFDALTQLEETADEETWEGFSFKRHVKQSERTVIERALRDAHGSVTLASRLLGFKNHQSLISLLNNRHRDLLSARTAPKPRRRQVSLKRTSPRRIRRTPGNVTSQLSILHVEDDPAVANVVRDILTAEGWQVESCADSDAALRKLTSGEHYDVLVLDNNLPGLSGLELVKRARLISHRRRTAIIMLSGDEVEKEAWRAGADDFVHKTTAASELIPSIKRVLRKRKKNVR